MSIAFCFNPSLSHLTNLPNPHRPVVSSPSPLHLRLNLSPAAPSLLRHHPTSTRLPSLYAPNEAVLAGGDDNDDGDKNNNNNNNNNDGGNNGGGDGGEAENAGNKNRKEALFVLAEQGRELESLPKDLKSAIEDGRVPAAVMERFMELEKRALFRWLMQFGGFKERLLADDLFLAKVFMECGVGIFTKVDV